MAKKRNTASSGTRKINKSQAIRDYKKSHPNHKPAKIAEALAKNGIKVSAQFVSTILSNSKKRKQIRKPGRPKGSVSQPTGPAGSEKAYDDVTFDSLLKVKQIVIEMGGIPQAKRALDALEQLMV